jgi:hypothetical protein
MSQLREYQKNSKRAPSIFRYKIMFFFYLYIFIKQDTCHLFIEYDLVSTEGRIKKYI